MWEAVDVAVVLSLHRLPSASPGRRDCTCWLGVVVHPASSETPQAQPRFLCVLTAEPPGLPADPALLPGPRAHGRLPEHPGATGQCRLLPGKRGPDPPPALSFSAYSLAWLPGSWLQREGLLVAARGI